MLLLSRSHDPYLNLAIEDALFRSYTGVEPVLYLWVNAPSVIIGQNQNVWKECRLEAMKRDNVNLVRRQSGGGAVYHDIGNLLFSFIMPDKEAAEEFSYGVVLDSLTALGINALRSGRNDLEIEGRKCSGSAYMHSKGAFLHHGTLLVSCDFERLNEYLEPSKLKLSAKGVDSVRKRVVNINEIKADITTDDVIAALCDRFAKGQTPLDAADIADKEHVKRVYNMLKGEEFLYGSTPPFDVDLSFKTQKGEYQLLISVKNAVIEKAHVYTDDLDTFAAQRIKTALEGIRFDREHMAKNCAHIDPELAEALKNSDI
ncbi:MAG: lipoate--protein ligase [Clostridia bacterium]|nr:lipoate--protein ligase [Clostridia bacterium]